MESKIGIKDNITDEELLYRLENLVYSQSMLSCFRRNKGEFIDKYLRNVFWSDDTAQDLEYEKNMSYGRDFHLQCQRIFMGIESDSIYLNGMEKDLSRIKQIKNQYEKRYKKEKIEFCTEYVIELENKLQATIDLLVKIYNDNGNIEEIYIWDWKVEDKEINYDNAVRRMQTAVYMYVVKESIGKDIDFSKIVMYYYQPKKNKNTKIEYSSELHEKNKNIIGETIKAINDIKSYK